MARWVEIVEAYGLDLGGIVECPRCSGQSFKNNYVWKTGTLKLICRTCYSKGYVNNCKILPRRKLTLNRIEWDLLEMLPDGVKDPYKNYKFEVNMPGLPISSFSQVSPLAARAFFEEWKMADLGSMRYKDQSFDIATGTLIEPLVIKNKSNQDIIINGDIILPIVVEEQFSADEYLNAARSNALNGQPYKTKLNDGSILTLTMEILDEIGADLNWNENVTNIDMVGAIQRKYSPEEPDGEDEMDASTPFGGIPYPNMETSSQQFVDEAERMAMETRAIILFPETEYEVVLDRRTLLEINKAGLLSVNETQDQLISAIERWKKAQIAENGLTADQYMKGALKNAGDGSPNVIVPGDGSDLITITNKVWFEINAFVFWDEEDSDSELIQKIVEYYSKPNVKKGPTQEAENIKTAQDSIAQSSGGKMSDKQAAKFMGYMFRQVDTGEDEPEDSKPDPANWCMELDLED